MNAKRAISAVATQSATTAKEDTSANAKQDTRRSINHRRANVKTSTNVCSASIHAARTHAAPTRTAATHVRAMTDSSATRMLDVNHRATESPAESTLTAKCTRAINRPACAIKASHMTRTTLPPAVSTSTNATHRTARQVRRQHATHDTT